MFFTACQKKEIVGRLPSAYLLSRRPLQILFWISATSVPVGRRRSGQIWNGNSHRSLGHLSLVSLSTVFKSLKFRATKWWGVYFEIEFVIAKLFLVCIAVLWVSICVLLDNIYTVSVQLVRNLNNRCFWQFWGVFLTILTKFVSGML